eukprot:GHRQ01011731.1.p4 GENE.GHRQ01011731.1~~GHRQ01011731.1.p4  ORF type:complete len:122 (+),score=49.38 GHRQ01011731.1:632-997(+)
MAPRKGTVPHNKGKGKAAQAYAAAAEAVQPQAALHDPAPEVSLTALQQLEDKRKRLFNQLKDVERQIFDLETKYLEGCNPHANALQGYEGLHSQVGSKPSKAAPVDPADRIFSGSSSSTAV